MNILSLLKKSVKLYSKKKALIDASTDHQLTYEELYYQTELFSQILFSSGIGKGNKVAIFMQNSFAQIISFFSLLYLQTIPVIIDSQFCQRELVQCLSITNTDIIITDGHQIKNELFNNPECKTSKKVVFFLEKEIRIDKKCFVLDKIKQKNIKQVKYTSHQGYIIFFTYRGFGYPLPVLFSEQAIINSILSNNILTKINSKTIISFMLPFSHIFALVCNFLGPISVGATIILLRDLIPRKILNGFEYYQINFVAAVPSLLKILLPTIKKHNYNLRELRQGIVGGDVYSPELFNEWTDVTDSLLLQGYGLTETSAVICNRWHKYRPDALGLPMKGVRAKILDKKNNPIPINQAGRLWIKAWCIMQGYYQLKEQTTSVFDQGWFDTGDIARMDNDGFFYFIGRAKKITKVGGFTVDLTEVENIIKEHPQVKKVSITIKQDPLWQQILICKIKTKVNLTKLDLIKYCRKYLAAYKVPRDFIIEKGS